MNREIKFRAWDGKNMLLNVGVHPHLCSDLSHDDEYYKDNQDGRWIIGLGFDSYKVMQYTGLKDKNGKEIYEGDIVKYTQHLFNTESTEIRVKVVKWKYDKWGIYETRAGESDIEVIGNIYENQELLK